MPFLEHWNRGDVISADRLNSIQTAIPGVVIGHSKIGIKRIGSHIAVESMEKKSFPFKSVFCRFVITELHDEYLTCKKYNAITEDESDADIYVAKPYFCRAGDDGQIVSEMYFVGQQIIAHRGIVGCVGVQDADENEIVWEAINVVPPLPLLYEATGDEQIDHTITAERINLDESLDGNEVTFFTLGAT